MNKMYLGVAVVLSVALSACSSKSSSKDQTSATTALSPAAGSSSIGSASSGASNGAVVVGPSGTLDSNGSPIVSGQSYFLRNVGSNLCVDLQDGTPDDGGVIQSYDCIAANPNQIWMATLNADNTLSFTSTVSAKCLDLPLDVIPADNNPYQTWDCTGVGNQSFNLIPAADGGYQLLNAMSPSQCLTDGGSDGAVDSAITCGAGSDAQGFDLIPADNADPANALTI